MLNQLTACHAQDLHPLQKLSLGDCPIFVKVKLLEEPLIEVKGTHISCILINLICDDSTPPKTTVSPIPMMRRQVQTAALARGFLPILGTRFMKYCLANVDW